MAADDHNAAALPSLIREMRALNDETTTLNAALREKRARAKLVNEMITNIMKGKKATGINTSFGSVIRKSKLVKSALSKKFIVGTLTTFFNGNAEMAEKCMKFLEENRSVKEVEPVVIMPGVQMASE